MQNSAKRRKFNWFAGVMAAACLQAAFVSTSYARGKGGPSDGFDHLFHQRTLKQLNLNEEQKKKLQDIRKEARSDRKDQRESLKTSHEELKKKMASDASEDELRKQFSEIQAKRAELQKGRFERMLKVRAVMTPEQRKQLMEIAEKQKDKRKGKWRNHNHDENDEE
ncbi:MAG: Spy/CpxP family protein refolding chaperone [Bdellovibrionota bacterium]